MSSLGDTIHNLRVKLNQLEVKAAEIKLSRIDMDIDNARSDETHEKLLNVPNITIECDVSDHDSNKEFSIPTQESDDVNALKLKKKGLKLDLQCHAIPEISINDTQNVSQATTKNISSRNYKSPTIKLTACDISDLGLNDLTDLECVPSPSKLGSEGPHAPICNNLVQNPNLLVANK